MPIHVADAMVNQDVELFQQIDVIQEIWLQLTMICCVVPFVWLKSSSHGSLDNNRKVKERCRMLEKILMFDEINFPFQKWSLILLSTLTVQEYQTTTTGENHGKKSSKERYIQLMASVKQCE